MSKQKECCPKYKPVKNLSLSDVVLLLAGYTSTGHGVVELGRNVCKEEEAKFIQGHPNEYAKCIHILRLAENIVNGGMATIVSGTSIHMATFATRSHTTHACMTQ